MARLPTPGGDSGNWGTILNDFLSQSLNSDGTLKDDAVSADNIQNNSITSNQVDGSVEITANKDTDVTLAADSDLKYPSQKAVKTYVDTSVGSPSAAVILAPGSSTRNVIQPSGDFIPLLVRGNASQTNYLQVWQSSAPSTLVGITSAGKIISTSSTMLEASGNPATTGAIALLNNTNIAWRNAANSANYTFGVNSSNVLVATTALGIGSGTLSTTGSLRLPATTNIGWRNSGNSNDITFGLNANDILQASSGVAVQSSTAFGTVERFRVTTPTTVDNAANVIFSASATTAKPLVVQMVASQSAYPIELQDSTGAAKFNVQTDGAIFVRGTGGVSYFGTSGAINIGLNAASSGAVRLANNANISFRNAANSADLAVVNVDASNIANIATSANQAGVVLGTPGGGTGYTDIQAASGIRFRASSNTLGQFTNTTGLFTVSGLSGNVPKFYVNSATTVDSSANVILSASSASAKPLVIQGAASQSARYLDVQNSAGTMLVSVGPNGNLAIGSSSWIDYSGNSSNTGAIRMVNATNIGWRNAANTTDYTLGLNSSDWLLHAGSLGAGVVRFAAQNTNSTGAGAVMATADTTSQNLLLYSSGTTMSGTLFGLNKSSGGVGLQSLYANNAPLAIGTIDSHNFTLGSAGTARMTVLSSGAVAIDTTTAAGTVQKFGINAYITVDNAANAIITASATTAKPLVIQGRASQSANLQEWQDSSGNVLSSVNTTGQVTDYLTINAQTGTTYTLALADASKLITLSNASAITLTVPTNGTIAFPVGTHIDLAQIGAGQVTVSPADGTVTINATPGLKLRTQYSGASLYKTGTNTWLLMGDLSA